MSEKVKLSDAHNVRAAQAVLQYGVGAMVDFPKQTLMTAAPEHWAKSIVKIYDKRLQELLGVDYFGMPCGKDELPGSSPSSMMDPNEEGISYVRFPEWYFCPSCRRFQPLRDWKDEYLQFGTKKALEDDPHMVRNMRCIKCKQPLVVSRFITACEYGHIDDFPWISWVHCQNFGSAVPICQKPALKISTGSSASESLEGITVECTTCGAKTTLKGAFDREQHGHETVGKLQMLQKKYGAQYHFACRCRHPWRPANPIDSKPTHYPTVLLRGSSSVYFPVVASSLVIPLYSSLLTTKIMESNAYADFKNKIKFIQESSSLLTKEQVDSLLISAINEGAVKISIEITDASVNQIANILAKKCMSSEQGMDSTQSISYRAQEYEALSGAVSVHSDDFCREGTNISEYNLPYVKQVSLIHKIREVQALIGFSRLRPIDKSEPLSQQSHLVSVKQNQTNWYPAYDVRGEGIFVAFDSSAIEEWEKNPSLQERVNRLNENYKASFIGENSPRVITGRFLLLHTLAHLLIRQLSFECGYSIASLRERIYCGNGNDEKDMLGILIYTASGDSEGTLGGLVRQGRADTFPGIFKKAIENAMTCSNDPVCSLSLGQGRDSLNLAACYSCTLIPETSCEEFNLFLDRATVVGTFDNKSLGFYSKQLFNTPMWSNELCVEINVSPTIEPSEKNVTLLPNIEMDTVDVSIVDLLKQILMFADNANEIILLDSLINEESNFLGKEKPKLGSFSMGLDNELMDVSLIWMKSKVLYFTAEYEEYYLKACDSDWKCFWGGDSSITAKDILDAIEEV